ncbi:hypothetical protein [Prauserella rugosa]|uniref:Uncharacterized protein n=1 Tax=Prauserella rugosa TaxID=43354 RepID=A0A660CIJ8_9PSEU|nr:hypothetical protein [Prauserella rugosa]KID29196.1 hypothetical protein HQ32_03488 [Prauserella sp. Am3]KMS84931.1 hypothetical protein ACZ91_45045 [Streptomyces regensis]TWH21409.1 hypothetical protein JD82_03273 [Prauserella rugosa]
MAEFDRTEKFVRIAEALDREFAARGMPLKPGEARNMLRSHLDRISEQLGIQRRSALKYIDEDTAANLARGTFRNVQEAQAHDDTLPPLPLDGPNVGLLISAFAVAARTAAMNKDPDNAADLCDTIMRIGMTLRDEAVPTASGALVQDALRKADLAVRSLRDGAWSLNARHPSPTTNVEIADQLRADLDAIDALSRREPR